MPDDKRWLSSDAPLPDSAVSEAELEEELHTIYDGPEATDMTRLTRVRSSLARKTLIGLAVFFGFLAAVSWAGFLFFNPTDRKFSGEGVELVIEGPHEIKSGEPITYVVSYRNGERVPLGTASLEMRLPKEFVVTETNPKPGDDGLWRVGSLAPGKDDQIEIKGVVQAPLGQPLDLQAILTYRPADFNSEFQKVATLSAPVADSVFALSATGPAKIMPGDKVTIDIGYVNQSETEFKKMRVVADFPPSFIPESVEPTATDDAKNTWNLDSIAPNTEGHIKISGTFASDAKGLNEIKARLGYLDANEEFKIQKEASYSADVVEGQLALALILNGKSGDQPVAFGDTLHYAVTWRNTGEVSLDDVEISILLDAQPDQNRVLLWNQMKDKEQGVRDGNRVTWTKRQVRALGRIGPSDEGTIDFDVPLLAAPLDDAKSGDYRVTSSLEAKIGLIDHEPADRVIQAPPFAAIVSSDARLEAATRYFNEDGIPIGSGPLPPRVDEATTYRVTWTLTNSLHDLADLKLSARLPDNVVWTGKSSVDAGDLKFDAAVGKIVWNLNWLPITVSKMTVSFDVAITPTADQRGKVPTLVDAVIFEARDKVNGNAIILSTPPTTTSPEADDLAASKGRVQ